VIKDTDEWAFLDEGAETISDDDPEVVIGMSRLSEARARDAKIAEEQFGRQ
jgi:hypothetical protein